MDASSEQHHAQLWKRKLRKDRQPKYSSVTYKQTDDSEDCIWVTKKIYPCKLQHRDIRQKIQFKDNIWTSDGIKREDIHIITLPIDEYG